MIPNELIKRKRYGDLRDIADHFGVTPNNMIQILKRPTAKRHKAAVELLQTLINKRDELIKS